jgi:hypothetical protein
MFLSISYPTKAKPNVPRILSYVLSSTVIRSYTGYKNLEFVEFVLEYC